jgi:Uma2 family endonuclease
LATTTGLLTVEQFRKLPETGPFYYELRHGEAVPVPRPKLKHILIQERLHELLKQGVPEMFIAVEFPFRALPEHELRVADVAIVSRDRIEQADREDNLRGAPDLVVEVLSPSNTVAEINDKEKLCLENGSKEFWIVDPDLRQVKVSTPDGITTTFRSGHEISLRTFGTGALKVDEIFA